ncbi:MAG TPA: PorV/PorQ family protein [Calditrichia bacterium]|nr:PorV/PorQ family protein [Calditrichota bacterium]HQU71071.1 PorV/PorQ family protein [Calditrichia bacterium]HQV30877.1 PorV/PorQ family protein [Calditrichia bacterium]
MQNKLMIIALLLLAMLTSTWAGDVNRIGTASGSQLLIPIGARSIGMGNAPVASIGGTEAIFWNPAGMSAVKTAEVMFNNMQYLADIDVNYLATVYNGGLIGSFGFSIQSLDFGDIQETTEEMPDGTGRTYSPTYMVVGASYSRLLTDRISAGVTGKFIYEGIQQTSASSIALDMGVQYTFGSNLSVGVVMKNIGTKMRFDGRDMERSFRLGNPTSDNGYYRAVSQESNIPSVFSFGLAYRYNVNEENHFNVNGTFSNYNEASDQLYGGIEYSFKDFFYLRGGYAYEAQGDQDQLFGGAFGAGLTYPMGNMNVIFDYAYRQITDYFDANSIFTLKLSF